MVSAAVTLQQYTHLPTLLMELVPTTITPSKVKVHTVPKGNSEEEENYLKTYEARGFFYCIV